MRVLCGCTGFLGSSACRAQAARALDGFGASRWDGSGNTGIGFGKKESPTCWVLQGCGMTRLRRCATESFSEASES